MDASKKDKDAEDQQRRQALPAAGQMGASGAAKPGAISSQRRKVVERGALDTPDTNRAVGGSDRM